MINKPKLTGRPIRSTFLAWLLVMCLCPSCTSSGAQSNMQEGPVDPPAESLEETVPDTEGPVISGAQNLTVSAGGTLSYRAGVTAEDDRDGAVFLQIDSSGVDLNTPGEYEVVYSAEDSSGNRSEVVVTVVITEPEEPEPDANDTPAPQTTKKNPTWADVEPLADRILAKIITDDMSQREKAKAIYNYVKYSIKYVGTSDKTSWIIGAYDGFTTARGDCFNYFACSKALLTRAGIPNVDLHRVGGPTKHYWQLVDTGDGYYHFDSCPHDRAYPVDSFMMTEERARAYTAWRGKNYYVYDYASCPVPVVGLSEEERNPQGTDAPEPPAEPAPEPSPAPAPETAPEPVPEAAPEPDPGIRPETAPVPEPEAQPEGLEG